MKRLISILASVAFVAFGLAIAMLGEIPTAFGTTSTSTITGWNVPDMTHLTYSLFPLILPLGMAAFFVSFAMYFKTKGDFVVTLLLIGLSIGSTFGMLGSGGPGSSTANIPIAQTILTWFITALWIWQGSQGGQPVTNAT